jgi:hypothetical protein
MVFLVCLEPRGICTPLGPQRRGQDGPPIRLLGGGQGLTVHHEARAALNFGHLGLWRTASPGPFFGDADRFDPSVEGMIAPGVWLAAPPSLPTPCIVGHGLRRLGRPSQPPRVHRLDMRGDALGFLGLGSGIGHCRRLGPLARVDHQQASLGPVETPLSVRHWPAADDTVSMPAARRLLAGAPRFCKPSGPPTVLLAPRLPLLAYRTGARD